MTLLSWHIKYILSIFSIFLSSLDLYAESLENKFGQDPDISQMTLSYDGKKVAFIKRQDDRRLLVVMTTSGKVIQALDVSEDKSRSFYFVNNDYLILNKSITTHFSGYKGKYEYVTAFSIDLKTGSALQLPKLNRKILYPQDNFARIIPKVVDNQVLMLIKSGKKHPHWTEDLYRVNLGDGTARRWQKGTKSTIRWYVGKQHEVLAREDFDSKNDRHQIYTYLGDDEWRLIFDKKVPLVEHEFLGLSADKKALLFKYIPPKEDFSRLYSLSLKDGEISEPILSPKDKEIEGHIVDAEKGLLGVAYSGMKPTYDFFDDRLAKAIDFVTQKFSNSAVYLDGLSENRHHMLFKVHGGKNSGEYWLYNVADKTLSRLATQRPALSEMQLGHTDIMRIEARDGLKIPTLVTYPPSYVPKKNTDNNKSIVKPLPAIMLPHGGPEAYDRLQFDYLAQYFASQGYMVVQPNFRGSTGFGASFTLAGRGKWGTSMQDDLSDVLGHLVANKLIDPKKVCIVGASYGGYAALAGGAFTPELYRCIVAIAPVSDLPEILRDNRRKYGSDHWVITYWDKVIRDDQYGNDKLKTISPAYHASRFVAPVLLLHGNDDTIVPFKQSKIMYKNLKKAKKEVKLVKLKNEDHWLSQESTRLEVLTEAGQFVNQYLK